MDFIRRKWSNLPIRHKLLSYFFVVLFFVSMFNVYLNNNNYNTMDQFNETMTNYYKINELMVTTQSNYRQLDRYMKEKDQDALASYYNSVLEIEGLIEELYQRFDSQEAFFTIRAIDHSSKVYRQMWEESIQSRNLGEKEYYLPYYEGEDIYYYNIAYVQDLLYISLREGTQMYNVLVEKADIMRKISLALIVVVFGFAMFIGGVFSSYIVRPIKQLASASKEIAKGNLDVPAVAISRKDEVGVLADSFNIMSEAIRDYVVELEQKMVIEKKLHEEELAIIRMEQLLKESEFMALQSQINPHFLFNTLNTISRTAMFESADDTVSLIQALSNLFRYRIRNSGDSVTLHEEMDLIDQYVYLQKVRFKERLEYIKDIQCDLEEIMIPVFTLQPLVENAIIHGIEPKVEGGKLRIKIKDRGDQVMITILDTGMGMAKEKVNHLIEASKDKKSERIGVANVFNRFMLYYDEVSTFKIMSKEGMGTMIRLSIHHRTGNVFLTNIEGDER